MNTQQLLDRLVRDGGAIVSSDSCSVLEIRMAQGYNRFATNEEGMGFVLKSKEWVEMANEGAMARLYAAALQFTHPVNPKESEI